MIVVSNTSPIINLAAIGKLDLLRKHFGEIIIPGAVHDEITNKGRGEPGDKEGLASYFKGFSTYIRGFSTDIGGFSTDIGGFSTYF